MKNKLINILIVSSIIVLSILLVFIEGIGDLDELWQYNFANNISKGLVPYKDFNIITTPLFSFMAAIFLKLIFNQLLVMRLFNTVIFSCILFLIYKIFRLLKINKIMSYVFVLTAYFLFYYDLGVEYNYLILIISLLSLYFELKNTEKHGIFNIKNDFILGVLIGLSIITKHSIGIILSITFIFYKLIFIKKTEDYKMIKRIIIYRGVGVLIPSLILVLYLILNNALYDFINYSILGISEFNNRVPYLKLLYNHNKLIAFFAFVTPINLISIIGLMKFRNNNKFTKVLILLIYSIALFIGIFPIANSGHFIIYGMIGVISTLYCFYLIITKTITNKKIKIYIYNFTRFFIIFFISTYIIINIINLINYYKNNNISTNELEHYYGIVINKSIIEDIKRVNNFIITEREKGNKVIILDSSAVLYMNPINVYNKDKDMFNKGNIGKNGESRLIKEISENEDNIYLILNDSYPKNWQTPLNIIDFVKSNKTKTEEIGRFDIYK